MDRCLTVKFLDPEFRNILRDLAKAKLGAKEREQCSHVYYGEDDIKDVGGHVGGAMVQVDLCEQEVLDGIQKAAEHSLLPSVPAVGAVKRKVIAEGEGFMAVVEFPYVPPR